MARTKKTTRKSTGSVFSLAQRVSKLIYSNSGMIPRAKMAPQQAARTGKAKITGKKALIMRVEAGGPPSEGADPQRERVWDKRLRSQISTKPQPGMALRQDIG
jgi:hypothetical protein